MPTVTLSGSAWSIQRARPTTRFGQINPIPIQNGTDAGMLLRLNFARIPKNATIVKATLRLAQHTATTGTRRLQIHRITTNWTASKINWNSRPSVAGVVSADLTQAAGPMSRRWDFDLTAAVQNVINGTAKNLGWRVTTPQEWQLRMRGAPANSRPPIMVINYTVFPEAPENLHPSGGATSTSHPWLTFDADDEITGLEIQVDPDANETTPAWSSGQVAATGGLLALNDPELPTPYPGLEEDSSTFWRARQRTAGGWSVWSEWAEMSRIPAGVLTITQPPSGEISDPTPTVGWDFEGVQTAWRVRFLDDDGDQLSTSGVSNTADVLWAPSAGFTLAEQSGFITVDVWDDTDRIATPGAPEYISATLPVTFAFDDEVDPVDTLEAVQLDASPDVTLRGTRSVIPDKLAIYRKLGDAAWTQIETFPALDTDDQEGAFEGTNFTVVDRSCPMVAEKVAYQVLAATDDRWSGNNPTVTITTAGTGVWITDLETHEKAVIWGVEAEQNMTEQAIVHEQLNRTSGPYNQEIVRRRLVTYSPNGTITGVLADVSKPGTPTARACEYMFHRWRNNDAGHWYRIHLGRYTALVILGDIALAEREENRVNDRLVDISFGWWSQIGQVDG